MPSRTQSRSPYMEFSKLRTAAKYKLAASGMMSYPLAELPAHSHPVYADGAPGGHWRSRDVTIVFPYVNSRMALPHAQPKTSPASR